MRGRVRRDRSIGLRHRAGIGITEESDCETIIVSEETGTISVTFKGEIIRPLESKDLRNLLYKHLVTDLSSPEVSV